jgi:hypothetical protein
MDAKAQRIAASGLVAVAVIIAAGFFVRSCWNAPASSVDRVANAANRLVGNIVQHCKDTLNATPIVTITEQVVVQTPKGIAELATASSDVVVDYRYEGTWYGSHKTMDLRGRYKAKAGFDVSTNFVVLVQKDPLCVTVQIPEPQLLSCEMITNEVIDSADGWWNKLTPADQAEAVNAMQRKARLEAQRSGIIESARQEFEKRIKSTPGLEAVPVKFQYVNKR